MFVILDIKFRVANIKWVGTVPKHCKVPKYDQPCRQNLKKYTKLPWDIIF